MCAKIRPLHAAGESRAPPLPGSPLSTVLSRLQSSTPPVRVRLYILFTCDFWAVSRVTARALATLCIKIYSSRALVVSTTAHITVLASHCVSDTYLALHSLHERFTFIPRTVLDSQGLLSQQRVARARAVTRLTAQKSHVTPRRRACPRSATCTTPPAIGRAQTAPSPPRASPCRASRRARHSCPHRAAQRPP